MAGEQEGTKRLLQSTLRCLEVLEALADQPDPVPLSDLARTLGVRRGTLHQQLQTLHYAGWVRRTPQAYWYLSLRGLRIGRAALEQAGVAQRLLPLLSDLAAKSGEAPAVAVLDRYDVLIIQRVESQQLVRADLKVGTRMPLDTSAAGRVILAHASPGQLEDFRVRGIRVPDDEYLARIREQGYAVQRDEFLSGLSAAAVPIQLDTEEELLTLSMAAPTERFDEERTVKDLLETVERFYAS